MENMYDILAKMTLLESKDTKPDFPDIDKDGDTTEPIAKAAKEVDEAAGDYSATKARAGKDIGKPGKNFAKIAQSAGKRYGSKAAGERVAGAVLAKLRKEDVEEARNPQALDYQEGPEDDEEYRRHHGLDDPDRQRERKLRATDYKTLDRLERQAVDRAKQIDEEPNEGNEFSGELAKAKATGAKEFEVDGKKYPVKESFELVTESVRDQRSARIYYSDRYQDFQVRFYDNAEEVRALREFAGDLESAVIMIGTWTGQQPKMLSESPLDDPLTRFRKRFAPSVMRDKSSREELAKLDSEYGERKKTGYGRGEEEDEDDEDGGKKKAKPAGEKRGRGRPKGTRRAIGAKGPTGRSKLMTREEDMSEDYDEDEYDEEGEMAQSQARTIEDAAEELQAILDGDENLPEWVQKKITLAKEYIDTARDYLVANRPEDDDMDVEIDDEEMVAEKMKSKAQARLMHATAGGADTGVSKKVAKEFIKKSHGQKVGDLPEKVKQDESKDDDKDEVEETTTSGSVATTEQPKGKSNGIFGKGVYESLEEAFQEQMQAQLDEGTTITINSPDQGEPSVSVNATGGDAAGLGELLKLAGMFGSSGYSRIDGGDTCSACGGAGMHEAGCSGEVMEEDLANSADNTTTMDTDYMTQELAGGLNGPKRQINPNNPADNPLAMPDLGKAPSGQVNLGAVAEQVERDVENRLLDLYKRIA